MNLKQLLRNAGISNNIIKEVEKKTQKTTAEQELEHQEKALAMTKMIVNEALRARQSAEQAKQATPQKTIIIPD